MMTREGYQIGVVLGVCLDKLGTPGKATGNDENWKGNKWHLGPI